MPMAREAGSVCKGLEFEGLLPYHRIGSDKYAGLSRSYTMAHIQPPSKQYMSELLEIVEEQGLIGQIGG